MPAQEVVESPHNIYTCTSDSGLAAFFSFVERHGVTLYTRGILLLDTSRDGAKGSQASMEPHIFFIITNNHICYNPKMLINYFDSQRETSF